LLPIFRRAHQTEPGGECKRFRRRWRLPEPGFPPWPGPAHTFYIETRKTAPHHLSDRGDPGDPIVHVELLTEGIAYESPDDVSAYQDACPGWPRPQSPASRQWRILAASEL